MTPRTTARRPLPAGADGVVLLAAAALLVGTMCSQHPHPSFNRVRRMDPLSTLFPNWCFFAPTPAQHDFQFYYRTLSEAEETSEWIPLEVIAGRRLRQIAWYPERRAEKAIFDLGTEVLRHLDKGFGPAGTLPSYRLLCSHLGDVIAASGGAPAKGFQFSLTRNAGYDTSEEPEVLFVSPYTPLSRTPAPGVEGVPA